jgi:predicted nucleotidyltransferase
MDENRIDIHTSNQIFDIAMKYADQLKGHIRLHSLYVYGSYVTGNFNEDSDIDIAVVADGFSGDVMENTYQLMKIRRHIDNRIHPHPFSIEDFNSDDPMAREIINAGIRIL